MDLRTLDELVTLMDTITPFDEMKPIADVAKSQILFGKLHRYILFEECYPSSFLGEESFMYLRGYNRKFHEIDEHKLTVKSNAISTTDKTHILIFNADELDSTTIAEHLGTYGNVVVVIDPDDETRACAYLCLSEGKLASQCADTEIAIVEKINVFIKHAEIV